MKSPKQCRLIVLSKELRETVHAYERKMKKLTPYMDSFEDEDMVEYRKLIYVLMDNLQVLEGIKKRLVDREPAARKIN
jgi:hypothetical protein